MLYKNIFIWILLILVSNYADCNLLKSNSSEKTIKVFKSLAYNTVITKIKKNGIETKNSIFYDYHDIEYTNNFMIYKNYDVYYTKSLIDNKDEEIKYLKNVLPLKNYLVLIYLKNDVYSSKFLGYNCKDITDSLWTINFLIESVFEFEGYLIINNKLIYNTKMEKISEFKNITISHETLLVKDNNDKLFLLDKNLMNIYIQNKDIYLINFKGFYKNYLLTMYGKYDPFNHSKYSYKYTLYNLKDGILVGMKCIDYFNSKDFNLIVDDGNIIFLDYYIKGDKLESFYIERNYVRDFRYIESFSYLTGSFYKIITISSKTIVFNYDKKFGYYNPKLNNYIVYKDNKRFIMKDLFFEQDNKIYHYIDEIKNSKLIELNNNEKLIDFNTYNNYLVIKFKEDSVNKYNIKYCKMDDIENFKIYKNISEFSLDGLFSYRDALFLKNKIFFNNKYINKSFNFKLDNNNLNIEIKKYLNSLEDKDNKEKDLDNSIKNKINNKNKNKKNTKNNNIRNILIIILATLFGIGFILSIVLIVYIKKRKSDILIE